MPSTLVNYTDWLGKYGGDPMGLPRFALDKLREAASPGPSPDVQAPVQFRLEELNPAREQLTRSVPDIGGAFERLSKPDAMPVVAPPTMDEEMGRARAGFHINDADIAQIRSEVPEFLARGNARREAEDAGYQRMAQDALMPQGRSAIDAAESNRAFEGLQQARRMINPAYARAQRQQDTLAGAETYLDPRMAAQRTAQRTEGLADKAAMHELMMKFGFDPRDVSLDEREHQQALELAQARNQLGGMLGMGGGQPAAAGGMRPMTEQQIRAEVLGGGGDENDVLETMAEFKAKGLLR